MKTNKLMRRRRARLVTLGVIAPVTLLGPTAAIAGRSSDDVPIPYLVDNGTANVACVQVSVDHTSVFDAGQDDFDNVYGFYQPAELTWTFDPGIDRLTVLTWAHGDIDDPSVEYEVFEIEAYDDNDDLVDSLTIEDRDQVFGDYETFVLRFGVPVVRVVVSFDAEFEPADASSGLIPFLNSTEGCPSPVLDGYLDAVEDRIASGREASGLPTTL